MQLPTDLAKDQEVILRKILNLLSACVDVLSSEGHLNAMIPMEMSQMAVQAMWDRDSPLMQIPHFDENAVKTAARNGVDVASIESFMDAMNPEENPNYQKLVKALGLTNKQLAEAAEFTNNKYPNLDIDFKVEDPDEITAGSPSYLTITIERQLEEDDELDTRVHAPFYPLDKSENWWLVVGNEATKALCAIKRVTIGRKLQTKLEYVVPAAGEQELTLYLMSDSYLGVDLVQTFKVTVAEGEDEDDEEDEDGDVDMDG
jgi:pre-mRNA-splicing helicase BRR2